MPGRFKNYVAPNNLHKLVELGFSQADIAKGCGLGRGSVSQWMAEGKCPKYANVAAECLVRRQGQSAVKLTLPDLLIVTVPAKYREALGVVVEGFGGTVTELKVPQ